MGTSVEMLEDFYGKKRMRDPKMATELTKDRKGRGSREHRLYGLPHEFYPVKVHVTLSAGHECV
jgi:hypothetical protein